MQILVNSGQSGFAAHIVDAGGLPLCGVRIKRSLWKLVDPTTLQGHICKSCLKVQAKQQVEGEREIGAAPWGLS
jgi:hypothetical protein